MRGGGEESIGKGGSWRQEALDEGDWGRGQEAMGEGDREGVCLFTSEDNQLIPDRRWPEAERF